MSITDEELVRLAEGLGIPTKRGGYSGTLVQVRSWGRKWNPPSTLTTWEGAGAVVEAMRAKGWKVDMGCDDNGWGAEVWRGACHPVAGAYFEAQGASMPEAIARAALSALGGTHDE